MTPRALEQQLITNLLWRPEAIVDSVHYLSADDFYDTECRILFSAIKQLNETDTVTFPNVFDLCSEINSAPYLDPGQTTGNCHGLAKQIKLLAAKRKAGAAGVSLMLQQENVKTRFEQVLGKRANAFMSSIISAVSQNKSLQDCEAGSIVAAGAIAATLDLPINPSLGMAHIVPYKVKGVAVAQFQIGWKGFVQLAMRSGQYKTLNAAIIHEGQIVKNNSFTGEMEFQEEKTSDKVAGYLLYFRLSNGFEKYFYMTKDQCEAHGRRYSRSYQAGFGPWKDDFDVMAMKTVVKMGLSKYGILSVEMQTAFVADQALVDDKGNFKYVDNDDDGQQAPGAIKRGRPKKIEAESTTVQEQKPEAVTYERADVIAKLELLLIDRTAGVQRAFRKANIIESDWKKADTEKLAAVMLEVMGPEAPKSEELS